MVTTTGGPVLADLPRPARALAGTTAVAAVVLASAVAIPDHRGLSIWALLGLAAGIALGEALRIDLPFRRAGIAQFNLSDAALTVGLLLLPPSEVVVAAGLGKLCWQLLDHVPRLKAIVNLSWYVAGTSLAALIVDTLAVRPGPVDMRATLAVGAGLAALTAVNAVVVSGIIGLSAGQSWPATARRILPTLAILTVSNAGLGLLAVLLGTTHPWALVALAIPIVLLYGASRERVHATVDRERSAAIVQLEHRLADGSDPAAVTAALVDGVGDVLGLRAAVWRDGRWATPPPVPSGLGTTALLAGTRQAPLGSTGGLLVAWPGELGITDDSVEWLGRLARSGGVHLDRAAARNALEQERATLRAVVDGTADGIFVVDDAGAVLMWNPAMARLAGTSGRQALGRDVSDVLGTGPWQSPGIFDVSRPGSEPHTWRSSVACVRDTSRNGVHVGVVHDVTEERRIARMKDDMLAVVSHELRTPLTPIKASAQLLRLRGDALSATQREELLGHIEGRADHLTRLVEDLLLVGQLSAERTAPHRAASAPTAARIVARHVDLSRIVREETAQLALSHPAHHLVCTASDTSPAMTDDRRIRQIVDNLVENACKFSPPGSTVAIGLRTDGLRAALSVADEGRGIAPGDLERIVEPFERIEDPLHMTTSGAGLGLFIVRQLVDALGGRLQIDSAPGQGTTVTVDLPLRAPGGPASAVRPARPPTPARRQPRVAPASNPL